MCDLCFMMDGLHIFQQQALEMELSINCRIRQRGSVLQYSLWLGYSSRVHMLECVILLIIFPTTCTACFKCPHKRPWTQSFQLKHYHSVTFLRFHICYNATPCESCRPSPADWLLFEAQRAWIIHQVNTRRASVNFCLRFQCISGPFMWHAGDTAVPKLSFVRSALRQGYIRCTVLSMCKLRWYMTIGIMRIGEHHITVICVPIASPMRQGIKHVYVCIYIHVVKCANKNSALKLYRNQTKCLVASAPGPQVCFVGEATIVLYGASVVWMQVLYRSETQWWTLWNPSCHASCTDYSICHTFVSCSFGIGLQIAHSR